MLFNLLLMHTHCNSTRKAQTPNKEADQKEKNTGKAGIHFIPQQLDFYSRIATKHSI